MQSKEESSLDNNLRLMEQVRYSSRSSLARRPFGVPYIIVTILIL